MYSSPNKSRESPESQRQRTTTMASISPSSFACAFHNQRNPKHRLPPSYLHLSAPRLRPRISCKSDRRHDADNETAGDQDGTYSSLQRRDVLLGLGGAAAASTGLSSDGRALADPISPPDLSDCSKQTRTSGGKCCVPLSDKVPVRFKPPPADEPMRIRTAAHMVTADYMAKYKRAVELMKSLPPTDPRSFAQQANVHCAFCDGAYKQEEAPNLELQIHDCWLFFPWHRFYLYFHERILNKLIKEEFPDFNFALPFWNWDAKGGMTMPDMYTDKLSSLYDVKRNAEHYPPEMITLDYRASREPVPPEKRYEYNLQVMHRQLCSGGKNARLFMGEPLLAGGPPSPGKGSMEVDPHSAVHVWVGDPNQPNNEDLGILYSAARDPIFYAHHSNIDRLWEVWKTLGGKRKNFDHPDWLDATFLFYDEEPKLVKVKVRDCLDMAAMRYGYQDVENKWINVKAAPSAAPATTKPLIKQRKKERQADKSKPPTKFPLDLVSPATTEVKRPKTLRSKEEKEEMEEVLCVYGLQYEPSKPVSFDVYVNALDETGKASAESSEFAGSFGNVPHAHRMKEVTTKLRLGITDLLEELEADDDDTVLVTLVPREGKVKIGGLSIDLASD